MAKRVKKVVDAETGEFISYGYSRTLLNRSKENPEGVYAYGSSDFWCFFEGPLEYWRKQGRDIRKVRIVEGP